MSDSCGGCRGLGAHSPGCSTQPGARWYRYAQEAESLGDRIGPNHIEAANLAYRLSGVLRERYREEGGQR